MGMNLFSNSTAIPFVFSAYFSKLLSCYHDYYLIVLEDNQTIVDHMTIIYFLSIYMPCAYTRPQTCHHIQVTREKQYSDCLENSVKKNLNPEKSQKIENRKVIGKNRNVG
jgi:hypothetical protein